MIINSSVAPVGKEDRIMLLDTLRGFAIFGILMVNMPLFFQPISTILLGANPDASLLHKASESFIKFFFEGKFYVIFSLLFGYGFWLFLSKKTDDGVNIIPSFRRRAFFLLLFGLLHIILLWNGDILLIYAVYGFLLLLFRRISDRGLVKWAIWVGMLPSILIGLWSLIYYLASSNPELKAEFDAGSASQAQFAESLVQSASNTFSSGLFSEIVSIRVQEYLAMLPGYLLIFSPMVLAMFFLGIVAARRQLLESPQHNAPMFKKLLIWSGVIGVILNAVYVVSYLKAEASSPTIWQFLSTLTHAIGGLAFGLFYVSGIAILLAKGMLKKISKYLSAVGRMALSNYLTHSLVCAFLFHSYGLGLYGKIEIWHGIVLTILIFCAQIPISVWWLRRFRFGPLEWMWRSLTYWEVQPFRL